MEITYENQGKIGILECYGTLSTVDAINELDEKMAKMVNKRQKPKFRKRHLHHKRVHRVADI